MNPDGTPINAQPTPTPTEAPAPAPQADTPTPTQPDPQSQAPIASPAQPTAPTGQPPVAGDAPTAPAAAAPQSSFYADYMAEYNAKPPVAPTVQGVTVPDINSIDPNDDAALQKFFTDFANNVIEKADERAQANFNTTQTTARTEEQGWASALAAYPTLASNQDLATVVQLARLGMPAESQAAPSAIFEVINRVVAEAVATATKTANTNVTYQASQPPNLGGGVQPAGQPVSRQTELVDIQQRGGAGADAAVQMVERLIRAGKI